MAEHALRQLSVASFLFANMLFTADHIVDRDWSDPGAGPIDMIADQFEAYRALAGLFAADSQFWDALRDSLVEYATVTRDQRSFTEGRRFLTDFTLSMAEEWAKARAAPATVTVVGLGELAGDQTHVPALIQSIQAYYVAMQLLDDVQDWRADLAARRPSYPLARAAAAAGVRQLAEHHREAALAERIRHALHFDGVIVRVLGIVDEQIEVALTSAAGLGVREWFGHLNATKAPARLLRERLVDALEGPRRRPALSIRISVENRRPWQRLAYRGLRWVLGQWRLGFPDARHIMSFPGRTDPGPHVGDVFSRVLIANALADADRTLARGQLTPCLATEVDHLLWRQRIDEPGLWSYLPTMSELPCDADDLAEALRLLTRTGRATAFAPVLDTAISIALRDGAERDGSFSTWLIPRIDPPPPWAAGQVAAVDQLWGHGTDPEVVANLLHAVAEYDAGRHRDSLHHGTDYLIGSQTSDGCWPSGWYHGWLYAAFQCTRAIALLRPTGHDALHRTHERVLATQLDDGGWASSGSTGNPQDTAVALLTLAVAHTAGMGHTNDRSRAVRRAHKFLEDNIQPDGGYAEQPFIRMSPQRSPGLGRELSFGSRSITTALVGQAAIAWDVLS